MTTTAHYREDARVYVMRGIPGSGKTTLAHELRTIIGHFSNRQAYRLNRDDFRLMMFGHDGSGGGKRPTKGQERAVLDARNAALRYLLQLGHVVILDDTNLREDDRLRDQVKEAAKRPTGGPHLADEEIAIVDVDTDPDECIRRDLARTRSVGEQVIRNMEAKRRKVLGLDQPIEWKPGYPNAILVDIDGTLAHMTGRGPYDWARVGEDEVDEVVSELVVAQKSQGDRIVLMSGRDGSCREATETWLATECIPYDELHMRAAGDNRKDAIVKAELFDQHVRDRYNVRFVLDDRDQVVRMWRARGLKVLQVAEGAF